MGDEETRRLTRQRLANLLARNNTNTAPSTTPNPETESSNSSTPVSSEKENKSTIALPETSTSSTSESGEEEIKQIQQSIPTLNILKQEAQSIPNILKTTTTMATIQEVEKFVEKRIPEFNGGPSTNPVDVKYFLDMCKAAKDKFGEQHKTTLFEEIKYKLTHDAHSRCCDAEIKSLDDLISLVANLYLPKATVEQLHRNLVEAKQTQTESVSEYSIRMHNLANTYREGLKTKYSEEFPNEVIEDTAIQAFRDGLRREKLRIALASTEFTSLKEIAEIATKTDSRVKITSDETLSNFNSTTCRYCERNGHTIKDCRTKQADIRRQAQQFMQQQPTCKFCHRIGHNEAECRTKLYQSKQNIQNISCNYCRRSGHTENECRTKVYQQTQSQNNQQMPFTHQSQNSNLQCNYCKKFGHLLQDCKKKEINNRFKTNQSQPQNKYNYNRNQDHPRVTINYVSEEPSSDNNEHRKKPENQQGLASDM